MKKKVLVRAPALSMSGYGEHSKFLLRALRQYEDLFDIYLTVINWGKTSWDHEDTEERRWIDSVLQKTIVYQQQRGQFDMSIQLTIPNEFDRLAPINIGVTAGIETDKVAGQWIEKCNIMDRIITISQHAKEGIENTFYQVQNKQTGEVIPNYKCQKPIHVVGYPVKEFEEVKKIDIQLDYDFNFLCVAQWSIRKNIENTIGWFLEEFNDKEVGLVLKISLKNNSYMDRHYIQKRLDMFLERFPNRKCKIYLLHGYLDESEMNSLYKNPKIKALISIPHGEGFGLPIFEAAYNGIPVISTLYGGQKDFLCMPLKDKETKEIFNKPLFAVVDHKLDTIQKEAVWDGVLIADSKWAFPEKDSYRKRLREVVSEYSRFKQQAERLKKYLLKTYTKEIQYKKFVETIIGEEIIIVKTENLPKVSIITSVFNGKDYIQKFFEDVERQSIFKDKCELILVHTDSSKDREEEKKVIDEYLIKYPENIKYLHYEEDKSLYWAWNEAIKASTGDLITNWNLDDRRAPHCIEKCAKEMLLNEGIDIVYFDQFITDKENEIFEHNSSKDRKYNFPEFDEENGFESLKMFNYIHAMPMWKKNLHDKYGLFEEKYKSAADWEFFLRCLSKGTRCKKITDILGLYFFNPVGISTNPENFKWKRLEEKEVYMKYKDMKLENKND